MNTKQNETKVGAMTPGPWRVDIDLNNQFSRDEQGNIKPLASIFGNPVYEQLFCCAQCGQPLPISFKLARTAALNARCPQCYYSMKRIKVAGGQPLYFCRRCDQHWLLWRCDQHWLVQS